MIDISRFDYEINYETIDIEPQNIDEYISKVKYMQGILNHISFDTNITNFDSYNNTLYKNVDKTFNKLLNDNFDCVSYFQDKDILSVSSLVDNYVDENKEKTFDNTYALYNLNNDNIWNVEVKDLPNNFPTSSKCVLSSVKEEYYSEIDTDTYVLYKDLPKDLYDDVIIEEQGIMFDLDKNEYFTKTMSQTLLFNRIENIISNGFEKPLNMLICNDGLYPLDDSKVDFILAKYLNLPHIPVAFISSTTALNEYITKPYDGNDILIIKKVNNNYDKNRLQEILAPYFNL